MGTKILAKLRQKARGLESSGEWSRFACILFSKAGFTADLEKIAEDEPPLPEQKAKPSKPGEGTIQGNYARSQPVLEVLVEDIQGIDDELVGMRILGRGLIERMEGASRSDLAQLGVGVKKAVQLIFWSRFAIICRLDGFVIVDFRFLIVDCVHVEIIDQKSTI